MKISYLASDPYNTTRIIDYTNTGTTTVTERDGGEWIYQYNTTNDRLTAKTDPQGNTTTYQYYPDNGKLWKKIKPEDYYRRGLRGHLNFVNLPYKMLHACLSADRLLPSVFPSTEYP